MTKGWLIAILSALFVFGTCKAEAGPKFVPMNWSEEQVKITAGAAYYADQDDVEDVAFYFQTPIIDFGQLWLSAGTVIPIENGDKVRGTMALSTRVSRWVECPRWIDLELGVYGCVGSSYGWGAQLGVVNFKLW